MSWNRIIFVFLFLFTYSTQALETKKVKQITEDELIISAIFYETYKVYDSSYLIYKKLFNYKKDEIYLLKMCTSALFLQKYIQESIFEIKEWEKTHANTLNVKRLIVPLYLTSRQNKEAIKEAEALLLLSTKPRDLELGSQAFLYSGKYERGIVLLRQAYDKDPNETVLLRLVSLMDEMSGKRKEAIQLLETHRRMNIVSHDVYNKLLVLYQKEQDIDGLLAIYKILYEEERTPNYLKKVLDSYLYKRDYSAAIAFMESYKLQDTLLYELYREKKNFKKAIALTKVLYAKDKNPKWIAEKAILTYEKSKNKEDKMMLDNVIKFFEKAISLGNDDSIYLNYYGYTLIDKEIDIKKGMQVIENALLQQPHNTYYLDSLAWGHYKQKACKKAYALMKQVVDEEGLKEKEIVEHWDAIKKCK